MASISELFTEAVKAGAKGAADSLFAPKPAAPAAAPAAVEPTGIDTPTPSALPSWLLPAAVGAGVLLFVSRR